MPNNKKRKLFPLWLSTRSNEDLHPIREFSFRTLTRYYKLSTNHVLLVGANTGSELPVLLGNANRKVTLVEPLPDAFIELKARVEESGQGHRIKLHNVAAGRSIGKVVFYPASNGGESSSTLVPKLHMKMEPGVTFGDPIYVPQVTLQDIISKDDIPDFWIIDTQGSELEVLKGAQDLLKDAKYLLIEVNRAENYEDCASVEEVDDFLLQFGYKRQVTRWWGTWGDAFYSRGIQLPTLRRLLHR